MLSSRRYATARNFPCNSNSMFCSARRLKILTVHCVWPMALGAALVVSAAFSRSGAQGRRHSSTCAFSAFCYFSPRCLSSFSPAPSRAIGLPSASVVLWAALVLMLGLRRCSIRPRGRRCRHDDAASVLLHGAPALLDRRHLRLPRILKTSGSIFSEGGVSFELGLTALAGLAFHGPCGQRNFRWHRFFPPGNVALILRPYHGGQVSLPLLAK